MGVSSVGSGRSDGGDAKISKYRVPFVSATFVAATFLWTLGCTFEPTPRGPTRPLTEEDSARIQRSLGLAWSSVDRIDRIAVLGGQDPKLFVKLLLPEEEAVPLQLAVARGIALERPEEGVLISLGNPFVDWFKLDKGQVGHAYFNTYEGAMKTPLYVVFSRVQNKAVTVFIMATWESLSNEVRDLFQD